MMLSKDVVGVLVDLIENKLGALQIGDREDLREMIVLQHCLAELQALKATQSGVLKDFCDLPRRGRRRKVADIMEEMRERA